MKTVSALTRSTVSVTMLLGAMLSSPVLMAQPSAVDTTAVKTLKSMTEFVAQLQGFSATTQVTLEDLLDNGQRIDLDVFTNVVVQRPNRIRANRIGENVSQSFYYDGSTLTLHDPVKNVYATQAAPKTIEEVLDYTRESLGLIIPVSDLVYRNAFEILMKDVTFATVIGQANVGGVSCTHLAFRRPDVDFQVWVATGEQPFPCKYVVTDTSTPELVSTVTVMDNWTFNPPVDETVFQFEAPEGARSISFLPLDSGSEN